MRTTKGRASTQHELELTKYLIYLENNGWKTVNLGGKSPDGIAVKNNEIVAIELLLYDEGDSVSYITRKKEDVYNMFNKVFVKCIEREFDWRKQMEI